MFTVQNAMDQLFSWIYYGALNMLTDFQKYLGNMGLELFDNPYAQGLITFFSLLAWSLFIVGCLVGIAECAIDYQSGGGNFKGTGKNILMGFFAVEFFALVPERLFALSVNLQSIVAKIYNLSGYTADTAANTTSQSVSGLLSVCIGLFQACISGNPLMSFVTTTDGSGTDVHVPSALNILFVLVFVISFIKVIFDNLKRGAILLAQICVCALYMFSIPRGYIDGFVGWCKQVVGVCFTVFVQNMFLVLGLNIFKTQMIIGIGIMLGAAEVPRIAQQFGLDTSTKANVSGIAMTVSSFANVGRTLAMAAA